MLSATADTRLSYHRTWVGLRRTTLLNAYTAQDSIVAPTFAVTTTAHSTTALTDTLAGRAPLTVATLEILRNGIVLVPQPTPVWSDETGRPILWSVGVPLLPGVINTFTVRGKSTTGSVIATGTVAITQTP